MRLLFERGLTPFSAIFERKCELFWVENLVKLYADLVSWRAVSAATQNDVDNGGRQKTLMISVVVLVRIIKIIWGCQGSNGGSFDTGFVYVRNKLAPSG